MEPHMDMSLTPGSDMNAAVMAMEEALKNLESVPLGDSILHPHPHVGYSAAPPAANPTAAAAAAAAASKVAPPGPSLSIPKKRRHKNDEDEDFKLPENADDVDSEEYEVDEEAPDENLEPQGVPTYQDVVEIGSGIVGSGRKKPPSKKRKRQRHTITPRGASDLVDSVNDEDGTIAAAREKFPGLFSKSRPPFLETDAVTRQHSLADTKDFLTAASGGEPLELLTKIFESRWAANLKKAVFGQRLRPVFSAINRQWRSCEPRDKIKWASIAVCSGLSRREVEELGGPSLSVQQYKDAEKHVKKYGAGRDAPRSKPPAGDSTTRKENTNKPNGAAQPSLHHAPAPSEDTVAAPSHVGGADGGARGGAPPSDARHVEMNHSSAPGGAVDTHMDAMVASAHAATPMVSVGAPVNPMMAVGSPVNPLVTVGSSVNPMVSSVGAPVNPMVSSVGAPVNPMMTVASQMNAMVEAAAMNPMAPYDGAMDTMVVGRPMEHHMGVGAPPVPSSVVSRDNSNAPISYMSSTVHHDHSS